MPKLGFASRPEGNSFRHSAFKLPQNRWWGLSLLLSENPRPGHRHSLTRNISQEELLPRPHMWATQAQLNTPTPAGGSSIRLQAGEMPLYHHSVFIQKQLSHFLLKYDFHADRTTNCQWILYRQTSWQPACSWDAFAFLHEQRAAKPSPHVWILDWWSLDGSF